MDHKSRKETQDVAARHPGDSRIQKENEGGGNASNITLKNTNSSILDEPQQMFENCQAEMEIGLITQDSKLEAQRNILDVIMYSSDEEDMDDEERDESTSSTADPPDLNIENGAKNSSPNKDIFESTTVPEQKASAQTVQAAPVVPEMTPFTSLRGERTTDYTPEAPERRTRRIGVGSILNQNPPIVQRQTQDHERIDDLQDLLNDNEFNCDSKTYFDNPSEAEINREAANCRDYSKPYVSRGESLQPINPFATENPYVGSENPHYSDEFINANTRRYPEYHRTYDARLMNNAKKKIRAEEDDENGIGTNDNLKELRKKIIEFIKNMRPDKVKAFLREFELALEPKDWILAQETAFYFRLPQPFDQIPSLEFSPNAAKALQDWSKFQLTDTTPEGFIQMATSLQYERQRAASTHC